MTTIHTTQGASLKIRLIALASALMLSACATTPMDHARAVPVPADRLVGFQKPIEGPSGILVLTRDKGFLGSGCYYGFFIDNTLAARIDNSETATFIVPTGELLLRAGRDPEGKALCGMGKEEWTQRETIMREGEKKYFRLSIDLNGKTDIQRADPASP
jgi:hypothetical protein